MGLIDSAVNAIGDWFKGILAEGISSCLNTVNGILSGALNNDAGDGANSLFGQYLGEVTEFTGSSTASGASPVWSTIETLSNNVIVPIAGFILMVVVIYELLQMVMSGNNFKEFDTSIFIRWIIKTFCGILLISNVFYISTAIFTFGTTSVNDALSQLLGSGQIIGDNILEGDALTSTLTSESIGTLVIVLIISMLLVLITFVLLAVIIIVLAQRIIEVFMYLSIAPIPMATMMNRDWGEIGKNWLRNILALAFQGFFIIVALAIFKTLFNNALADMLGGNDDIVMSMATLLGFTLALMFTMFRTSSISKSIFNAH